MTQLFINYTMMMTATIIMTTTTMMMVILILQQKLSLGTSAVGLQYLVAMATNARDATFQS